MQPAMLGYPKGRAASGPCSVRAVSITVIGSLPVADGRIAAPDAPSKLSMCCADAGIDDTGVNASSTCREGEKAAKRQITLIQPVKPPRRFGLSIAAFYLFGYHLIRFDMRHRRVDP